MMKQKKQPLSRKEFIQKLCDEINEIQQSMDRLYERAENKKEYVIESIRRELESCAEQNNPFKAAAMIDYVLHNEPIITIDELHLIQDPYKNIDYDVVKGFGYNSDNPEFVTTFLGALQVVEPGE